MTVVDRWAVMLLQLAGDPLPPPPKLPGRRHVLHDEPASPEEERAALLGDRSLSLAELGRALGVSRQRVFQLRQAARGGSNLCEVGERRPSGIARAEKIPPFENNQMRTWPSARQSARRKAAGRRAEGVPQPKPGHKSGHKSASPMQ